MFILITLCTAASVVAGLVAKRVLDEVGDEYTKITNVEMVLGSLLCAVIVIPLITLAGFSIVRHSTISYNEFWSGLETRAYEQITTCHRDGACHHHYDCDPYTVVETYTVTVSDGNGKSHTETRTRLVTKYHDCPYTNTEHTFKVDDTLGDTYTLGDHWFPTNPEKNRWRNHGLPSNVPSGVPANWLKAKERLDTKNPGGTTKRAKYDNYIQASQDDIYQKYSDAIAFFKKHGYLPKVVSTIHDVYLADKAYLPTGAPPGTTKAGWQEAVMRLDGYIGKDKHGDLHLVVVDAERIPTADEYTQALDAYWQSDDLGKNTLSKNGIVVVVGYQADKVAWARAFTGMPVGNEGFAVAVRENLPNTPIETDTLIANIKQLVFAKQPEGFKRVEMHDYKYLFASIQPSGWQKFWIAFVAFLLSLFIWAGMATFDIYIPIDLRKYTRSN